MAKEKNSLNIVLGVDLAKYAKDWKDAAKVTMDGGKATTSEAAKASQAIIAQIDKIGKSGTLKQAGRQMENLLGTMSKLGMTGTKAFNEVVKQAGHLKAEMADVQGFINAARPDAPFQALTTTLQASAQAFAGVQGAMALFGAESEDLQKTLLKVQAAMAFAEGFKAIDGLMDGFQQLSLVIKANPFLLVGAAAATAIAAIVAFNSEVDKTEEALNKASDATIAEKVAVESLLDVINDENASAQEKLLAKQALIDQYPDYLGGLDAEKSTTEEINTAVVRYIRLLDLKAKAQAMQELYVEALKKEAQLQREANKPVKAGGGFGAGFANLEFKRKRNNLLESLDLQKQETKELKAQNDELQKQLLLVEKEAKITGKPDTPKKPKAKKVVPGMGPEQDKSGLTGVGLGMYSAEKTKEEKLDRYALFGLRDGYLELTPTMKAYNDQQLAIIQANREIKISSEDLTSFMQNQMVSGIGDLAAAFGQAAASGEDMAQALGKAFLSAMSDFLRQFGQMMIKAGIAKLALDKSLVIPGGGPAAIAAGAALIAIAAATRAHLSKGPEVAKMATGGIIPAGFPNDTFPAMLSSNEMVIPLERRGSMFPQPQIYPLFDGRSLRVMLRYANNDYDR